MSIESDAKKAISRAIVQLLIRHPFFATLALRLRLQCAPWCQTAAVDGTHLFYSPKYVTRQTSDTLMGIVAHEVMHCASRHHLRMKTREHKRWNIACDHIINLTLLETGFSLPPNLYHDEEFRGMSEEAVYALLPEEMQLPVNSGDGESSDGDGEGDGGAGSQSNPGDFGGCGSVISPRNADGSERSMSEAEVAADGRSWEIAAVQAAKVAKARGNCPAGIERMLGEILEPKANFRQLLARFVDRATKTDYSWCPPNRRHIAEGLYLPSVSGMGIGEVVIAVDTSGSMSQEDLDLAAGAINAVMRDVSPERVTVIYVDAADWTRCPVEVFNEGDWPLELHPTGGGGTKFTPAFDWVRENHVQPTCLIYITDLYCNDFPAQRPPYPVLWARTETANTGEHVPWGQIVDLM